MSGSKMHHLYPTSTGDPLCPVGFHPQVRWPTRCKRCFRDYKEHKDHGGGKKSSKDTTVSTPSLTVWESNNRGSSDENRRSWSSTSNLSKNDPGHTNSNWSSATDLSSLSLSDLRASEPPADVTVTMKPPRPRTYAGSSSDSFNFRRFSVDESSADRFNQAPPPPSRSRIQIREVIDKTNGNSSDTDAEYVIQHEVERLRTQLSDMRSRCERIEREKAEILLRRVGTIDISSKPSADVLKLQKTVKDLQAKNDAMLEERSGLASKIKSLERELNLKTHKSELRVEAEELRSKLKAAETLCDSLMDENEDMKKEIRELEEEIYEMQDNFREEQVDEYTTLRKNLEQSNKNCRVLSFKMRKIERKAEQLEADKADLEQKYDQIKRIEDILKKVGSEYKNRTQKKTTEYSNKMQLKKLVDGMEKDIGEVVSAMVSMIDNRDLGLPSTNFKYDKLAKEHELLKEKLDKTLKELKDAQEKEGKKTKSTSSGDDPKSNDEVKEVKKKLDESQASRELERKSWDAEKVKLQEEKEKLKSKLLSLSADKLKVYNEVVQLKKDLEAATSTKKDTAKIETAMADLKKELAQERERSRKLQDDMSALSDKETRLAKSLMTVETAKIQLENDLKQTKIELENAKNSTSAKIEEVAREITQLKKEKEKLKTQLEKEKQAKEDEIKELKRKNAILEKAGLNSKKLDDLKQTYEKKVTHLESEVKRVSGLYDELSNMHEKLGESKSQLERESQLLNGQLIDHKQDYLTLQAELQEVKQMHEKKEAEWAAQKSRLEDDLRAYEKTMKTAKQGDLRDENIRLKKESSSLTQQIEDLKRANDDISSKLEDYTRVGKIQRNFSADNSALEMELRKTKKALADAEKSRKADIAQTKLRYEQRVSAIGDEIKTIQTQLNRYKRERDTYKQMLEGAQKTIGELKSARPRRPSSTSIGKSSEDDEVTSATRAVLEKQIVAMEDELSDAKLESSKLKNELISEKSAWEIKFSELQSRINELEEERMLASGRTKIPGLKVRMELAWQKEREDQQRLLQETATLARDLRQTLFEVERERDKERLENKRKQDQLKKSFDEEKDENKKKLVELQCDLLELRDAHAKLRTSNEKMRREKERHEREREDLRSQMANKRRSEQNEARNLNILLQQVDDLMRLFPEMNGNVNGSTTSIATTATDGGRQTPDTYTPTPPRRMKSKSRESSPGIDMNDSRANSVVPSGKTEKLEYTIKKLMEVAKELQDSKKAVDDNSNRRRTMGKRSSSIDNDNGKVSAPSRSKPGMKRKSLSLEQTTGRSEQSIWGNNNVSSLTSLNGSDVESRHYGLQRDSSIESRLSAESTQSEIVRHEKKHSSKGIIRKITTKLTKSASVDDPNNSGYDSTLQTSGSEASINEALKKDKKNLKKKLSNMFKRAGSKSNGLDKKESRPSSRTSTVSMKP